MKDQAQPDANGMLIEAQSNPVMSLRQARTRFEAADVNYRTQLYHELAVAYAAHAALLEDPAAWSEFVEISGRLANTAIPTQPKFPQSLQIVVSFVFVGRHSQNRAHKFARALEILHAEETPAELVAHRLKDKGIDFLYGEATERLPRRNKAVAADQEGDGYDQITATVIDLTDPRPEPEPELPAAVDDTAANEDSEEDIAEWQAADESYAEPRLPNITVDPYSTLWVSMDPARLAAVLAMNTGDKARIGIECVGLNSKGWKLFDARRFERAKRS